MSRGAEAAIMILATAAVIAGLYFARGPLTQFALAMVLFFGIDGFARWASRRTGAPGWLSLSVGAVVVLSLTALLAVLAARTVGVFVEQAPRYADRLNQLLAQAHAGLSLPGAPPTMSALAQRFELDGAAQEALAGVQGVLADFVFIGIYLAFLFAASASFGVKLDRMFEDRDARRRARETISAIRRSMGRYLWAQTLISLLTSVLTYGTLVLIGFENALFVSYLIFFLNYIPTVGSIIATIVPTALALVQFDSLGPVALTAAGVGFWQFFIGNVVQPRMMGDSLNLSALVVLLSLALWGLIWGIAGAFLSAPLTVLIMIVLARFPSTRWLAILLSADGEPERAGRQTVPSTRREAAGGGQN